MPLRIFTVTGTPYGAAASTAARTIAANRSRFQGSTAPPPLRVTLGTGQPKLRSMWSARSSLTSIRTAALTVTGSTPYSWIERRLSSGSCSISCIDLGVRSTRAREVTISLTYRAWVGLVPVARPSSPASPYSLHNRRKARLVTPAIGASTTGESMVCRPIRSAGSTGSAAVMIPKLSAAHQAGRQVGHDLVEGHPLLGHRVTLTHGHCLVVQGVEVDRDAERCADLVLAAIAPTDGAGVIEVDRPVLAQLGGQVLGLGGQISVARQRQDGDLYRRQPLVEPEHDPLVHAALGIGRLVLGVGIEQERHQRARQTSRRFDDIRDEALAGGLIEVGEVSARGLAVGLEVEVGAVGDALELPPLAALKTVSILDVHGAL